jgi:hypothetical protein
MANLFHMASVDINTEAAMLLSDVNEQDAPHGIAQLWKSFKIRNGIDLDNGDVKWRVTASISQREFEALDITERFQDWFKTKVEAWIAELKA